jgi:chromate reductase
MTTQKIAVLVGSLRKESFSRKTALALMAMAPESLKMEIVDIGALPIYNQDFDDEGKVPPEWTTFREKMKSFDGLLFVTPEYNRSVPGVLKNALDVGSRPYGKSIWSKKPGAIVSVSPGALGGFGANHHLRQSMVFLDVPLLQQPEMYVGNASKMFDASGKIIDDHTKEFFAKFMKAFVPWVTTNLAPRI